MKRKSPAVLTDNDCEKIRSLYKSGKFTQSDIAERFGTTQPTISRIISNKRSRKDR